MLQPSPLSPSFTHYLPCSWGGTALKEALLLHRHIGEADEMKEKVIAYLLSIGAPR